MSSLAYAISDTAVLAKRNLKRIPRQPDLLIAYTIQPVMFIVLFVYVFRPGRPRAKTPHLALRP